MRKPILTVLAALVVALFSLPLAAQERETYEEVSVEVSQGVPYTTSWKEPTPPYLPDIRGTFLQTIRGGEERVREVTATGRLNIYWTKDGRPILWIATESNEDEPKCWGYVTSVEVADLGEFGLDTLRSLLKHNGQWVSLHGTREQMDGGYRWWSSPILKFLPQR